MTGLSKTTKVDKAPVQITFFSNAEQKYRKTDQGREECKNDNQTTHAKMGSPHWHLSVFDITFKNSRGRTALDMLVSWEMTEQTDWRAKSFPYQIYQDAVLSRGRSEVFRSLRQDLRTQGQGHQTIDRLEERNVERERARRASLTARRGPSSIRQTLELF